MKFFGELLVFILLLITNLRVFFVNHVRRDPLVIMAPFTLFISILQLFSWGIDVFTVLACITSLLVFLSNFHAMFRYSEHLFIDRYSPLMKVWAVFTVTISLVAIGTLIWFAPVEMNSQKHGITESRIRYKGSFKTGFEPANSFSTAEVIFHEFKLTEVPNAELPESKGIILFIPDKRGETFNYKPYLQLLAKEGYTVCSADFYADDCKWMHSFEDIKILRRMSMVIHSLSNNQWFMAQREFYTYNISLELKALEKILQEQYGEDCKYYLISDVMGNTAIDDYVLKNKEVVTNTFFLDSIADYPTAGYGCIQQTDPLLATFMGLPKDSKMELPHLLVKETKAALEVL